MKRTTNCLAFLLLFGLLSVPAFGAAEAPEIPDDYNRFSFGLSGGLLIPFTDVKEENFLPASGEEGYGAGLFLNYHASPVLTLQTNFLYGEMTGLNTEDNRKFDNIMMHASLTANVSLNGLLAPRSSTNRWMNIYGFTGLGAISFESKLMELQTGNVLRYPYDESLEGQTEGSWVIPFGMGVNFKVSERIDIGVKSSFQYAMTDELDAKVVPGSRKDMYNYTSVGLTFRLGNNTNSKDWAPIEDAMYPGDVDRMNQLASRMDTVEDDLSAVGDEHDQHMKLITDEIGELTQEQVELLRHYEALLETVDDLERRMDENEKEAEQTPETFYSVQVMAHKKNLDIEEAREYLGINDQLQKYHIDGWYKYISGNFDKLAVAIIHMRELWANGVSDAFVVKYEDGVLIPK
ncbi:MAG: outer membrane beta-barrel protein [Bacteroidales bacterium]